MSFQVFFFSEASLAESAFLYEHDGWLPSRFSSTVFRVEVVGLGSIGRGDVRAWQRVGESGEEGQENINKTTLSLLGTRISYTRSHTVGHF